MPAVAIGAVVGLIVATATASLLRVDQTALRAGMYGFNGILVGAALPTFLGVDVLLWAYIVVGAAVSSVAMQAIAHVMTVFKAPALTFPFVLTTWLLLLGAYAFSNLDVVAMGPPAVAATVGPQTFDLGAQAIVESMLRGISQVFLIGDPITGAIFILGLAVSSVWAAAFAVVGTVVAFIVAVALGASTGVVTPRLFGVSAVLTAIALGSVFFRPGLRVTLFALLGVVFTVVAQGALDIVMAPLGIPTLTFPFVIVTWLFLLPREDLAPTPHLPIPGHAVGTAPAATA
jgi:urea transporter